MPCTPKELLRKAKTQKHPILFSRWAVLPAPHGDVRRRYLKGDSRAMASFPFIPWFPSSSNHTVYRMMRVSCQGQEPQSSSEMGTSSCVFCLLFIENITPCNIPLCSIVAYSVATCPELLARSTGMCDLYAPCFCLCLKVPRGCFLEQAFLCQLCFCSTPWLSWCVTVSSTLSHKPQTEGYDFTAEIPGAMIRKCWGGCNWALRRWAAPHFTLLGRLGDSTEE